MEKPTTQPLSIDVQGELFALKNIMGLAAFAAESRRILLEIHEATTILPELGENLSRYVELRSQWTEYPDCLAAVLSDAHWRIDALLSTC